MAPSIPKAYGFVILVNVIGASFMLVTLSFKVGAARKEYKIDLPTMYATGKDKKSVTFNCIQRGHQQALETFSTVLACSLIGGIRYPLSTWIFGVGYIKSRMEWAKATPLATRRTGTAPSGASTSGPRSWACRWRPSRSPLSC